MPPSLELVAERARELVDDWELTPARIALVVGGLVCTVVVGVVAFLWLRPSGSGPPPELSLPVATPLPSVDSTPEEVLVHVAGAVAQPGLYAIDGGARVADAVAAASGPTADADLDRVNLAAPVTDGERVYVPAFGEPAPPPVTGSVASGAGAAGAVVDLNTATLDQLDDLPGVGPATAEAIVAGRPFASVDDLLDVRGIGPAKLEDLRPRVRAG